MTRRISSLVLLLGLGACRSESEPLNIIYTEPQVEWNLRITLERGSVEAGETLDYALVMVSEEGDTELVEGRINSLLEPDLYVDGDSITPIVAGEHTLAAVALFEDEEYTAFVQLDVRPGPLHALDLALSDLQAKAGDPLDYTVRATDWFGNAYDTSEVSFDLDSADVIRDGDTEAGTLSSTLPGVYTVVATIPETNDTVLTDVETFQVVPGDPVLVNLTLSDTELELFETTAAQVDIFDAYGNVSDADWTLSVDGPGETTLAYRYITFWEEGEYTVRVDVDDTGLWDEVGPLLIDSSGPTVEVDEPDRGGWSESETGTVSGTVTEEWSGIDRLTVNDEDVSVGSDGSFSTEVDYLFGLNILETSAVDGDGNVTTDTRSVLQGDFVEYEVGIDDGMVVRIHEGDGGFGAIESLAEELVSAQDLDDLIPNPVVDEESESCIDLWFTEICITWYALYMTVSNPSISGSEVSIDPTSGGYLDTSFAVLDPSIDWDVEATLLSIDYDSGGSIEADDITVSMDLTPSVSSNILYIDVSNVDASSSNFDFDWDSWIYDVMDFFGLGLDSLIQGYMEDAIEDAVEDEVPELLEDALNDLEISFDLEMEDRLYTIDALPSSVSVDDLGLTLGLMTEVLVDEWTHTRDGAVDYGWGSLYGAYTVPTWTGTPATAMAANLDFVNQLLYVLWGGGLLDMELPGGELGLDADELEFLLGTSEELTIVTEALLPPVVIPGTATEMLDFQLGDLHMLIYAGEQVEENVVLEVYLSVLGGMDMDSDGETLQASLGDLELYFDVVVPDATSPGAQSAEALLEALMPLLLPSLTGAISEVPIPSIDGFGINNISVGLAGSEDGFVEIGGEMEISL